jgi:hypothetical protein
MTKCKISVLIDQVAARPIKNLPVELAHSSSSYLSYQLGAECWEMDSVLRCAEVITSAAA